MKNVIVATDKELKTIKDLCKVEWKFENPNMHLYRCNYKGRKFHLLQTGIGKINVCKSLHFASDLEGDFINVGTCASLNKSIKLGQVVQVSNCCQWDLYTLDDHGTIVSKFMPVIKYTSLYTPQTEFVKVNCATGDSFVFEKDIKLIKENFLAVDIVDMEVAAAALFLKDRNLSSYKLVSDYANEAAYELCDLTKGFKEILDKVI